MSVFIRRPGEIDLLPPSVVFESFQVLDLPVSDRTFEADSEDISPEALSELIADSGPNLAFSRLHKLTYLLSSPDMVSNVLTEFAHLFVKGEEERALAAVVGWGLLAQEGKPHKAMQRELNPGVRGRILDTYLQRVVGVFSDHVGTLTGEDAPLVAFTREVSQSAAELSLFGVDEPTGDYRYHQAVLETNRFSMSEVTPGRQTPKDQTARFVDQKEILDQHVTSLVEDWAASGSGRSSFMDYLIGATESLPDSARRVRDQAGLFMQAATETTASLVSWMFLHLTHREDVWQRLLDEAKDDADEPLTYDYLQSLDFHQAVVSETLRVTPPVWMLPRVATEDVVISGVHLPRGARAILSPWVSHRHDPTLDQPLNFQPERWLAGNPFSSKGHYFPFGMGGRICIGEAYGRMAAVAMLHTLVKSGRTVSVAEPTLDIGISHLLSIPRLDLMFAVH